jgi:hypothetical protein
VKTKAYHLQFDRETASALLAVTETIEGINNLREQLKALLEQEPHDQTRQYDTRIRHGVYTRGPQGHRGISLALVEANGVWQSDTPADGPFPDGRGRRSRGRG